MQVFPFAISSAQYGILNTWFRDRGHPYPTTALDKASVDPRTPGSLLVVLHDLIDQADEHISMSYLIECSDREFKKLVNSCPEITFSIIGEDDTLLVIATGNLGAWKRAEGPVALNETVEKFFNSAIFRKLGL